MRIDRLTSGILQFPSGQCVFICGTQIVPYQRVQILGIKGRIGIEIPFNAPTVQPCRIFIDDGVDLRGRSAEILEFEVCNQYTIQGDLFSKSIRQGIDLPVPVELSGMLPATGVPEPTSPRATGQLRRPHFRPIVLRATDRAQFELPSMEVCCEKPPRIRLQCAAPFFG